MKYKSRPSVIEAVRFLGLEDSRTEEDIIVVEGEKPSWFEEAVLKGTIRAGHYGGSPILLIDTLEGVMSARVGSWVIKGTEDELYPCKHSVFKNKYEEYEDA